MKIPSHTFSTGWWIEYAFINSQINCFVNGLWKIMWCVSHNAIYTHTQCCVQRLDFIRLVFLFCFLVRCVCLQLQFQSNEKIYRSASWTQYIAHSRIVHLTPLAACSTDNSNNNRQPRPRHLLIFFYIYIILPHSNKIDDKTGKRRKRGRERNYCKWRKTSTILNKVHSFAFIWMVIGGRCQHFLH